MSDDPVVLTAEMARWLTIHRSVAASRDVDAIQDGVEAIRDGRTVVVPRITEEAAREAFWKWYSENQDEYGYVTVWLAALRHYGILLPTGEKG